MRPKYKISKSNLKEFFWTMKKANPPEKIEKMIQDDPVLQQLRADMVKINKKYEDDFERMKKEDPKYYQMMVKAGIIDEEKS